MLTRELFAFVLITGLAPMIGHRVQALAGEESGSSQTQTKALAIGITVREVTSK